MVDNCAICGCRLHRRGHYAEPTAEGRSHATKHHYVAKRFFGRSENRTPLFPRCPWNIEGRTGEFCYDCHEELLHNPVFLPKDVDGFRELVELRNLNETVKTGSRRRLAKRVRLLHEVLECGLAVVLEAEKQKRAPQDSRYRD